ncbi:VOC family protein [Halobellus captivus]|uniref:VOC family protein n=1 Tax=Halobellus captivus TaxID=2592614 RepID=UPI0011A73D33|nr:VOC family protein [Halobellus captivus]
MTDSTVSPDLPADTRLGRTALRVDDLEAMIDFYRTVVGLELFDRRADGATLGVDNTPLLELDRDSDAPPRERNQAGLFHNAFLVPSRTALGAALERVQDHWRLDGASDHRVSEALYLSDPEGNGIEIYRDRPRDQWPRTADGGVEMPTLPLDLDDVASASDGAPVAPEGTTLGHVHLEVTSIAETRRFYVETLGFDVQMDVGSALFVSAGGYHHHFGLNAWNGRSAPAGGRGLAWVEIVVPGGDALDRFRERLEGAEIDASDVDPGDPDNGQSAIHVVDPNGIPLRVRVDPSC